MVHPVVQFLQGRPWISMITMQNLVVVSHTVCAHAGDTKLWGMLGSRPFGMGAWLTPSKYAPLPYVTIPNIVPYLGLYGVPFGDAEALPHRMGDVTDPLETCFFPPVFHAKFGRSMSNHMNVIMEICQKNLTLVSHLSRSLKVTGTNTDRSVAYDFQWSTGLWAYLILFPR